MYSKMLSPPRPIRTSIRSLTAAIGIPCLLSTSMAFADCREQISELDETYSSAGFLLGDEDSPALSGYIRQSQSLRDTALIMLSTDREEECRRLIVEAQLLANRASMPSIFSAEELVGKVVTDVTGQEIGTIKNIMVDLDRGVVAYALVAFGGFLGFGEDLVPVPFGKFSLGLDADRLELAARQETIENAPRYIGGDTDLLSRRSWAINIYQYYGEDPYWTEQRRKNAGRDSSSGKARSTDNQEPEAGDAAQTGSQEGVTDDSGKSHLADVAAHSPLEDFNDLFGVLDTDTSGAVSKEEARREFVVLNNFSSIDGNGDGEVGVDEFSALTDTHQISADGQTLIPKARDAKPEEAWTGGKIKKEAVSD